MLQNRSLVFYFAATFAVACGGDEDVWFSNTDAAPETAGSRSGDGGGGNEEGSGGQKGGDGGAGGRAPNDAAATDATDPADSGTDTGADATTGGRDGEGQSDATAEGAAGSAGAPADAGVDGCARPTVYYPDKDKDGYGSTSGSIAACAPPATGRWVSTATDCNDGDSRVHPGQAAYFEVAYRAASGASSFDYDCSGSEEEDPSQAKAPANCGLLSLTLCGGSGYAETARAGQGLSPYCGSRELRTCRAALAILLCETVTEVTDEPFRCR